MPSPLPPIRVVTKGSNTALSVTGDDLCIRRRRPLQDRPPIHAPPSPHSGAPCSTRSSRPAGSTASTRRPTSRTCSPESSPSGAMTTPRCSPRTGAPPAQNEPRSLLYNAQHARLGLTTGGWVGVYVGDERESATGRRRGPFRSFLFPRSCASRARWERGRQSQRSDRSSGGFSDSQRKWAPARRSRRSRAGNRWAIRR